ncbi:hypothetical protein C2845_PM05G24710 [Panicum miliaceum]|uniref:Uncharacterized protein n=1 Tax=Panicum miliaceum TaxID=4540 RepID=A0A3L6T136_PANMI|nr:hypothetical protein C2845_PM05G24710 [Panicum miliaceum]
MIFLAVVSFPILLLPYPFACICHIAMDYPKSSKVVVARLSSPCPSFVPLFETLIELASDVATDLAFKEKQAMLHAT